MFLHTFYPSRIAFAFGAITIYWYGIFIIFGILLGMAVILKISNYYKIKKNLLLDLLFWLSITNLLGARIYHILLEWTYYSKNLLDVFKIWHGGLAVHGAIFTGLVVIWIFAKKNKINFWLLTGIIAPGVALAQAIGRWGNYFNQELFGKPTDLPWGIPIDIINRPAEYLSSEFFHPTFLYESIGNFLIFIILIILHIYIIKKHLVRWSPPPNRRGDSSETREKYYALCVMCYMFLYSALRFSLEFIRIDITPVIFNLRFPQIISLLIILISILFCANYFKTDIIDP